MKIIELKLDLVENVSLDTRKCSTKVSSKQTHCPEKYDENFKSDDMVFALELADSKV